MRIRIIYKLTLTALGLASLGLLLLIHGTAFAANPTTMNFQGKVVNADGTNVTNGTYSFIFRIYNASSPTTTTSCTSTATCLWEETQSSVTVTNGVFQVELGSVCSLTSASCNNSTGGPINWANNSSLYLTMQFNGDSAGFMTPTIHITSVPFAFQADNSSNLGGLAAGNFVQLAQGVQNDSSTTNASIFINKNNSSGTPNILELQKSNADVLVLTNAGMLTLQPAASLTSGQTAFTQTLTNGSSTGGTVNGYSQTITVSATSSASTTNGFNISIADATALANINQGINISLSGSNTSQIQVGVNSSVNHGQGVTGTSTGTSTAGCGGFGSVGAGVCGVSSGGTGTTGVFGQFSGGSVTSGISDPNGTALYGRSIAAGVANDYNTGVKGLARNSAANTISIGVYGDANNSGGTGAVYGGYFQLQGSGNSGSALFASNNTNAVNILELKDNTTDTLTVGDNGLVTSKTTAASTTAFQVQNTSGGSLFNIDNSRTVNLITDGDFEIAGNPGWSPRVSPSMGSRTSTAAQGNWALDDTTSSTSTGSGAQYNFNFAASKTYYLSFFARVGSGTMSTYEFGHSNDTGSSDVACQTGVTLNTTWQRFTCSWTTSGTVSGTRYLYFIETDNVVRDIYLDAVQLESSDTSTTYTAFSPGGALQLLGPIESPLSIENRNDTTQAFQVQTTAGAQVLSVNTVNSITNVQGINSVAAFGSELLNQAPPNNNFNNATYWTLGTGWGSATSTQVTATSATGSLATTSSDLFVAIGNTYKVVFTVSSYSGSECITPTIGGAIGLSVCGNSTNETQIIGPATTSGQLTFTLSGSFSGIISNVSVEQLTQATNAVISVNNSDGTAGIEIRAGGSGLNNTLIGIQAGESNTTGNYNVALGNYSLYSNTVGQLNVGVGYNTLSSNTTGNLNVAVGGDALQSNTTGSWNNAVGSTALLINTTGLQNNALGHKALYSNTSGSYNNAVGDSALLNNSSGNYNVGVGDNANCGVQTGSNNVAVGYNTLCNGNIGSGNTAIGDSAGDYIGSSSNNNLFIGNQAGYYTGAGTINLQNATAIGYYASALQDNSLVLGGIGPHAVNIGIGTTSPTNTLSVSPDIYDTGTASVTSGTSAVSESGATWSSNFAGMEIIFADGTKYTISSATATTITLSSNATVTETASAYRIHNPAFYVSSTGSAQVRTSTNSTTAFQVQNAANQSVLVADTTNGQLLLGNSGSGVNGTLVFNNSAGSGTAAITLAANPSTNYTYQLPTGTVGSNQCLQSGTVSSGTVPLLFSACSSGGGDNGFVNSVAVTDFNLQDVAGSGTVTGTAWTGTGSSPTNITLAITNASATAAGAVTNGTQTFAGVKTFQDFVILQPAASMTAGQTDLTQTITNAGSTGGTVNGYSQTITVNNTSSASTTNGINIVINDNASSITNTDIGIKVSLGASSSNSSRSEIGVYTGVSKGIGIYANSTGTSTNSLVCGSSSATQNIGVCGDARNTGANGVFGYSNATGGLTNQNTGVGVYGLNGASGTVNSTYVGVKGGTALTTNSIAYTSVGVEGITSGGNSSTTYGGYFTLDSGSTSTSGAALYASNSSITENIFQLQDNTTSVFTVGDGGLITLQPADGSGNPNLVSGQTEISQSFTNASTTGGTVNGYSQTITVSNTTSASTTNGINISLTDSTAGSLANVNTGIAITLQGTNSSQKQVGVDINVNKGIGIRANSTGSGNATCNGSTGSFGVCGTASGTGSTGVYGETNNSSSGGGIGAASNAGVYGVNDSSSPAGSSFNKGVVGAVTGTAACSSCTNLGVYGSANGGSGATLYGGYFTLGTGGSTAGSALYATNSTVAANIFQLQDNTTSVFTVGDAGLITLQPADGSGNPNLVSGQTEISQSFTNASSTGGTVNGYSQTITVSNTTSASTTNGINISLSDATALGNTNKGINISLSGSNASQIQYGIDVSTNHGAGLRANSSGGGGSITCGNNSSGGFSIGVCGVDSSASTAGVGVLGESNSDSATTTTSSPSGTGVSGVNYSSTTVAADKIVGAKGYAGGSGASGSYISIGVVGAASAASSSASTYGGYFTLNPASSSTAGAALYASNSSIAENIFQLQDNTTSVFTVGDGGLITLQPADGSGNPNLIAGQTEISQSFTNASSTGGTVNGYSQTITVSNTTSASTTNGINITINDTASSLANTDTGLKITLGTSSTNTSRTEIGVNSSVTAGIAINGVSTGAGNSVNCGPIVSAVKSIGVCGDSTQASGTGVLGRSQGLSDLSIGSAGVGVYGTNNVAGSAAGVYAGAKGIAAQTAAAAYTSVGVLGKADGGAGATLYGGYFTLGTSGATLGSALYASNSTVAANIIQLQDNNVNALVVNSSGATVLGQSNTGGLNGTIIFDNSSNTNTLTLVTGATAASGGSGFTLTLPTTGASAASQCLQSGGGSSVSSTSLTFGACGTALSVNGTSVGATGNLQNTSGTTSVAATTFTNTSGNITLTVAAAGSGTSGIVTATGTQTFDGSKVFTGSVQVQNASGITIGTSSTAGTLALFNGTNTVSIQGAGSTASYTITLPGAVAGAAGQCLVSTGANGILQWQSCGAGSTRTEVLTPEFAGAVMTGDGTNNTGTMTSDFCSNTVGSLPAITTGCNSGETHNFYQWTANATNDYDIFVKWAVPSDFSSFSAFSFNGFRTSTSDAVTVTLYNAAGTSCGSASIAGTVNTWNDNTAVTTSCTPSAGNIMTIDIHLSVGVSSEFARMGEITITYNRN